MEPITYDTPGPLLLVLDVAAGEVRLRTSDTPRTTLHISGDREASDVDVHFDPGTDGRARLVVSRPSRRVGRRAGRELVVEVSAPAATRVRLDGRSTDLVIDGTLESVSFSSASGDAVLGNVVEDLEVSTASGGVRAGRIGGRLSARTASGDVAVDSVAGDVVVNTASGDVEVGDTTGDLRISTASGDVTVGSALQGLASVQTASGRVVLGVAPGTRAYLDVSSLSGRTASDLPVSDQPSGDGGPQLEVRVSSVSGDVLIRRAKA